MSDLIIKSEVDTAIEAEGDIVALREQTEANFLELGARLDEFIQRGLFKALGHRTVNEWLDSRQLGIGRAAGWELINVWRTFGQLGESARMDLARAGHKKLALLAGKVESEVIDVGEAVELAGEFSFRELSRRFKQPAPPTQKIDCPTCGHPWPIDRAPFVETGSIQVRGH